VNKLKKLCLV